MKIEELKKQLEGPIHGDVIRNSKGETRLIVKFNDEFYAFAGDGAVPAGPHEVWTVEDSYSTDTHPYLVLDNVFGTRARIAKRIMDLSKLQSGDVVEITGRRRIVVSGGDGELYLYDLDSDSATATTDTFLRLFEEGSYTIVGNIHGVRD